MKIDKRKVHAEIRQVLDRQKELRKLGHKNNRWYNTWGEKARYLSTSSASYLTGSLKLEHEWCYLSARMTILCCILAHAKGKLHAEKMTKSHYKYGVGFYSYPDLRLTVTPEIQEKLIGDEIKQFLLDEEAQAA